MKTFIAGAAVAVVGALVALPWENIVSAQTAGVIAIIGGGIVSIVKAVYLTPPAAK